MKEETDAYDQVELRQKKVNMDIYCDNVSELVDRNKQDCGRACRDMAMNSNLVEIMMHIKRFFNFENALKHMNVRVISLLFRLSRANDIPQTRSNTIFILTSFENVTATAAGMKKIDTLRVSIISDEYELPCDKIIRLCHDLKLGPHVKIQDNTQPNYVTTLGEHVKITYSKHFVSNNSDVEFATLKGVQRQGLNITKHDTFESMAQNMQEDLCGIVLNPEFSL